MKKHISTLVSLSVIGITSIAFAQSDNDLLNQAKSIFSPLPDKTTPPKDNPITPEKVKLGKKLYFEKKLSIDNTISCNSCHLLDKFGVVEMHQQFIMLVYILLNFGMEEQKI